MAEKIIFLDFDGVLNSLRSYAAYGDATFCRTSVDLILTLLKQTGAKIVISSSWRESFSFHHLSNMFRNEFGWGDWADNIIGTIEISNEQRGNQIDKWINRHYPDIIQFVIIDDYDGEIQEHQLENLVHVNPTNGFCYDEFVKCKELLS